MGSFWDDLGSALSDAWDATGGDIYNEAKYAVLHTQMNLGVDVDKNELAAAAKAAGVDMGYKPSIQGALAQTDKSGAQVVEGASFVKHHTIDEVPYLNDAVNNTAGVASNVFDKAGRGVTAFTLAGDSAELGHGWRWQKAWEATAHEDEGGPGITFGEAMTQANDQGDLLDLNVLKKHRDEIASSWADQTTVASLNILGAIAADPTRGIGRAVGAVRAARTLESSAQADKVFDLANGIKSGEETGEAVREGGAAGARHLDQVKSLVTPNQEGFTASAAGHLDEIDRTLQWLNKSSVKGRTVPDLNELSEKFQRLARTSGGDTTAGVQMHLFDQSMSIADPELRMQTQRNILLAGAGSQKALHALVQDSPDIARAMQRMSSAPEGMAQLDDVARAAVDPTVNFSDLAERIASDPANAAELKGFASRLDDFHERIAQLDDRINNGMVNEAVGRSALDKLAAGLHAKVGAYHTYQDAVGSRTMGVVSWAAGKVAPGAVDMSNTFTGADQLIGTLKQSGVFKGPELAALRKRFMTLDQAGRNQFVEDTFRNMTMRQGKRAGLSDEMTELVTNNVMSKIGDSRAFGARALAKDVSDQAAQVAANDRLRANTPNPTKRYITLHEPGTGVAIRVERGLLEGHLAMSAPSVDPRLVERVVQYHAHALAEDASFVDKVKRGAEESTYFAQGLADLYTQIWKFGVLGRPGLGVRALLDTQLRSAAMIGGVQSVLNAGLGAGHAIGRNVFRQNGYFKVPASSEDLVQAAWHEKEAARLQDEATRFGLSELTGSNTAFYKREATAYEQTLDRGYLNSPKIAKFDEQARVQRDQLHAARKEMLDKMEAQRAKGTRSAKGEARKKRILANYNARIAQLDERIDGVGNKAYGAQMARSGYLKGNAGHSMNMSREETYADRIAAHLTTAQTLRDGTYQSRQLMLGTKAKTFKLSATGQKVTSAAYRSARDQDAVDMALSGGHSATALMTSETRANLTRIREDAAHWTASIKKDDPDWSHRYVRSVDALSTSPTAIKLLKSRYVLDSRDAGQIYRQLRNDSTVKAEWAQLKNIHPDFDTWLNGVARYVKYYVPNDAVADALIRGARMTSKDVDALIPKGQRFDIHGPDLEYLQPPTAIQTLQKWRDKFFRMALDKPDQIMVRHPTYVSRYNQHFKALAGRWADEVGDIDAQGMLELENRARHRAIQDVRRYMYDPTHLTRAHQTLRFISPFIRPWEDALRSWSRLIYDNPNNLGKLAIAWNSPNLAGLVVDAQGRKVDAWGHRTPQPGSHGEYVVIPIPGHPFGITEFRANKMFLNSIAQSDEPLLPGFGPMAQVPVQLFGPRLFPELFKHSDNPLLKSMFMDGTIPKSGAGDILKSQLPSWVRAFGDAFNQESGNFARIYQSAQNNAIIQAQQKGLPTPSREELDRIGTKAARSGGIMRMLASFTMGMSGSSSPEGNFYLEQYQILKANEAQLAKQRETVDSAFHKLYPEAADLPWTISVSDTGINATVKAELRSRQLKSLIDKDPKFGYLFVGTDNVGGQFSRNGQVDPDTEYNSSVYNSQFTNTFGPEGAGRRARTKAEILDRALQAKGWAQYQQLSAIVDTQLRARGLDNLQQKGAQDLADKKKLVIEAMKADNPTWAADYEDRNSGRMDQFLRAAQLAMTDPRTKNREDIQALSQYLQYRSMAEQLAQQNGFSLKSNKAVDFRARLYAIGSALARQSLGFDQAWQRDLEGEVSPDNG